MKANQRDDLSNSQFGDQFYQVLGKALTIFLAAFVLFEIISIGYFQFCFMDNQFYHESAFPLLYAEEIQKEGGFLTRNFSGREVAPLSWPVVGALLLAMGFPISLGTQSLLSFLFTLFLATSVFFYARTTTKNWNIILFSVAAALFIPQGSPMTYGWLDQVYIWPMNSYGVYDAFSLVFFVLAVHFIGEKYNSKLFGLLALAFAFATGLNGIRGTLMLSLPVVIPMLFLQLKDVVDFKKYSFTRLFLTGALLMMIMMGFVVTKVSSADLLQPWQDSKSFFIVRDAKELPGVIYMIIQRFMQAVGIVEFNKQGELLSLHTIDVLMRLALLGLLFYFLCTAKSDEYRDKIAIWRSRIVIFVILFSSFFANGSIAYRYFIPAILGLLFLLPIWMKQLNARNAKVLMLVVGTTVLANCGVGIVSLLSADPDKYIAEDVFRLTEKLEEKGLTQGFVGPWQAHGIIINQVSGGKIRVGDIKGDTKVRPSGLSYHPHGHADQDWFTGSRYDGSDQFIAYYKPTPAMIEELPKVTKEHFHYAGWDVWVFDGAVPFDSTNLLLGERASKYVDKK